MRPGKQAASERRKQGVRERRYFAWHARRARQEARLSQRDLADRAGLTQKWISEIEQGRANLAIDTMAALAVALKVPLHKLLAPPSR